MIDELERVRRFRAEEPPPSTEARQEASSALARAIRTSGARTSDARAGKQGARRQRAPRRGRRRLVRAVALVTAVAACLLVVELAGTGSNTGPPTAVAAALEQLARIAATGPSLAPGPGQYLYVDSLDDYPGDAYAGGRTCVTYATDHRQVWIGANGSGLLRDTTGATTFTSAADRATCLAMTPTPLTPSGTSNNWFAADCFQLGPTNDMQALSTDPRTLLAQMRHIDGGPDTPAEDFVHVGDFMRETDASPALRAALYRAAALIPGVHLLGQVRDHLGRTGLGVAYDADGDRHELIFNSRTSELMGEQDIASGSQGDWAVYLQTRVVNRLPHSPPIPLSPPCVNGGGAVTHTSDGDVQTGPMP
jgi:hypothetical protein